MKRINTLAYWDCGKFCLLLIIFGVLFQLSYSTQAGILYSDQELWASGDLWKKTQAQWDVEKTRHTTELKQINDSKLSVVEKDLRLQQEYRCHKAESMTLARQRNDVQAVMIRETNARVSGGKYRT